MTEKTAKSSTSFSHAFRELQKITERFERDDLDLELAMREYERGLHLAKQLKSRLKELENAVVKMKKKMDDEV